MKLVEREVHFSRTEISRKGGCGDDRFQACHTDGEVTVGQLVQWQPHIPVWSLGEGTRAGISPQNIPPDSRGGNVISSNTSAY